MRRVRELAADGGGALSSRRAPEQAHRGPRHLRRGRPRIGSGPCRSGDVLVTGEGIQASGEVGDPDPFLATMDAIAERRPDEVIVSTHPASQSGWLRRDLVERIQNASALPVEHIVTDIDQEGLPFGVTLVVATRPQVARSCSSTSSQGRQEGSRTCSSPSCRSRTAVAPRRARRASPRLDARPAAFGRAARARA